jgi:hypothetical protein
MSVFIALPFTSYNLRILHIYNKKPCHKKCNVYLKYKIETKDRRLQHEEQTTRTSIFNLLCYSRLFSN